MNLGFVSDWAESAWGETKRVATTIRDEARRYPENNRKQRNALLKEIPIIGDSIRASEAAEEQYRKQEAAAAAAIEAAKTAEAESIAAAKAKTDEERRRRMAYGRESTFVSSGLAGNSMRKTLLGE